MNQICNFRNENVEVPLLSKDDYYISKPFGIRAFDGDVEYLFYYRYGKSSIPLIQLFTSYNLVDWTELSYDIDSTTHLSQKWTIPKNSTLYFYGPKSNVFNTSDAEFSTENIFHFIFSSSNNGKVNLVGLFSSLKNPDWKTSIHLLDGISYTAVHGYFRRFFGFNDIIYNAKDLHINFSSIQTKNFDTTFIDMFRQCKNLLNGPTFDNPMPYNGYATCYYMFEGCDNLETAEMPWIVEKGPGDDGRTFGHMFQNCPNIKKIIYRGSRIVDGDGFLDNSSSTGVFYNLGGATYTAGTSGVPSTWTIKTSL